MENTRLQYTREHKNTTGERQTWETWRKIVDKLHTRVSAFRLCTPTLTQQPINGRR